MAHSFATAQLCKSLTRSVSFFQEELCVDGYGFIAFSCLALLELEQYSMTSDQYVQQDLTPEQQGAAAADKYQVLP